MFPLSKNRREIDRSDSHCVSWERQEMMTAEGWLISHLKSLKIFPCQRVNGLRVKLVEIVLSFVRLCIHFVCSFWNLRFYWHANERNPLLRLREREHLWSSSSERKFSIPHAAQQSMIFKIRAYWVIIDVYFFPLPRQQNCAAEYPTFVWHNLFNNNPFPYPGWINNEADACRRSIDALVVQSEWKVCKEKIIYELDPFRYRNSNCIVAAAAAEQY